MKEKLKHIPLTEWLCIIAFAFSALLFFHRIYPIIFAVHDDLRNYTLVRRHELLNNALHSAQQGRISHLWNHLLLGFPFILNKVWFYKLVQYSALLFDVWAMWIFVSKHIDRSIAWLSSAAFMAFASISASHSLFISYALCHQIPIGFMFLSMHFFMLGISSDKRRYALLSCIFFLAASMIYEAFPAFIIVLALIAALQGKDCGGSFSGFLAGIIKRILPQLMTAAAYITVYIVWQKIYPPRYSGTALYLSEPFASLSALVTYSVSMFPLNQAADLARHSDLTVRDLLSSVSAVGILKALLISAAFAAVTLKYSAKPAVKRSVPVVFVSVFIPNLMTAFSFKHIMDMKHGAMTYVSSYYSYMFLIIFICALVCMIFSKIKTRNFRIIYLSALVVFVMISSLSADYVTLNWKNYYTVTDRRYMNFDRAVSSEAITGCDKNWQIYAPDNKGIHHDERYTLDYIGIYDDTPASRYICEADDLDSSLETMCILSDSNYLFMAVGAADSELHAGKLTVVTILPEHFDIEIYDEDGQRLVFEDISAGDTICAESGSCFDITRPISGTIVK